MKQKMGAVYFVIGLCIAVMGVSTVLALMDVLPTIVAAFIVVIFALILSSTLEEKRKRKLKDSVNVYGIAADYNNASKTLYVENRNSGFKDCFSIRPLTRTVAGYSQEKIVYTGATVGGITTGGFHKEGGVNAKTIKTSKSHLFYSYLKGEGIIDVEVEKIELSVSLAEEAKKSIISEYLDGNIIQVCYDAHKTNSGFGAIDSRILATEINMNEEDEVNRHPTREKCQKIIDWLSMVRN